MVTDEDIINKLTEGESYYLVLTNININNMNLGLQVKNIKKIDSLFYIILTLRYRVDREVFDNISTELYYKLVKLLPINII